MIGAEVVEAALCQGPELLRSLVLQLAGTEMEGPLSLLPDTPTLTFQASQSWIALRILEEPSEEDRASWPECMAELERRTKITGDLLVLTPSRDTARWAKKILHREGGLGTKQSLSPVVLRVGLDEAEILLDGPDPRAALLAAWGIQRKDGPRTRKVLAKILAKLDEIPSSERAWWLQATLQLLSETQLTHIRAMQNDLPRSEAFSQFFDQIEAQAEARGKARSLLKYLDLRKIPLSQEQRDFIESCIDLPTANRWVDAVFAADRNGTILEAIFSTDAPSPTTHPPANPTSEPKSE